MFSVTLPDAMEGQLKAVIEETGGTISELVANAVDRYLREIEEDRQDIEAARLALEEYERDGGGVPWEQFKRELGLG
ncbi:MAG: hypothetical protein H7836_07555 [Magnetococcus sp. YQC-3]